MLPFPSHRGYRVGFCLDWKALFFRLSYVVLSGRIVVFSAVGVSVDLDFREMRCCLISFFFEQPGLLFVGDNLYVQRRGLFVYRGVGPS